MNEEQKHKLLAEAIAIKIKPQSKTVRDTAIELHEVIWTLYSEKNMTRRKIVEWLKKRELKFDLWHITLALNHHRKLLDPEIEEPTSAL